MGRRRAAARVLLVLLLACVGLLVFAGVSSANDTCTPDNKGDCRNTAGVIATAGTVAVVTAVVTTLLGGNGKKPTAEGCAKAIQFLDAEIDAALAATSGVIAEREAKVAEHGTKTERYSQVTAGTPEEAQLRGELNGLIADIDRLAGNVAKWSEHIDALWKQRDAAYQKCQDLGVSYRPKPDVNRPRSFTGAGLPVGQPGGEQQGTDDPLRNCRLSLQAFDEQLDTAETQARAAYAAYEAKAKELVRLQTEVTALLGTLTTLPPDQLKAAQERQGQLETSIADVGRQVAEAGTKSNGLQEMTDRIWENRDGVWQKCDGQHPGNFFKRPAPELKEAVFTAPTPGVAPPVGPGGAGSSPATTTTTTADPGGMGTTPGGTGTTGTTPGGDPAVTGPPPGDPTGGTATQPGDPTGGTATQPGDPTGKGTKPGDPTGGAGTQAPGTKPADPAGGGGGGKPTDPPAGGAGGAAGGGGAGSGTGTPGDPGDAKQGGGKKVGATGDGKPGAAEKVINAIFGPKLDELRAPGGSSANISPGGATNSVRAAFPKAPVSIQSVGFHPGADGGARVDVRIPGGTASAEIKAVNGMVQVTIDQIPSAVETVLTAIPNVTVQGIKAEAAQAAQNFNLDLARRGLKVISLTEKNGFLQITTGPRGK